MKTYTVTLTADAENAFASVIRFDRDAVIELENEDNIYTIETKYDIEQLLDMEPGVFCYDVTESS